MINYNIIYIYVMSDPIEYEPMEVEQPVNRIQDICAYFRRLPQVLAQNILSTRRIRGEGEDFNRLLASVPNGQTIRRLREIYLLRYQLPAFILDSINLENFRMVFTYISRQFYDNHDIGLVRIATLRLFNGNVYYVQGFPPIGIDTLSEYQFMDLLVNFPDFIKKIIMKTFIEATVRNDFTNHHIDQIISIDLYYDRELNRSNIYHTDIAPDIPTTFFSLTYLFENNNIVVRGASIMSREDALQPNGPIQIATVAVGNGTTICIDNTVVLHSTPDIELREPNEIYEVSREINREMRNIQVTQPVTNYSIEDQTQIQQDTNATRRTFIRIWFIEIPSPNIYQTINLNINFNYDETIALNEFIQGLMNNNNMLELVDNSAIGINISDVIRTLHSFSLGGAVNNVDSIDIKKNNFGILNKNESYKKNIISKNLIDEKCMLNNLFNDPTKPFIIYKNKNKKGGNKNKKSRKQYKKSRKQYKKSRKQYKKSRKQYKKSRKQYKKQYKNSKKQYK